MKKRQLLIGAVALVKGRVREDGKAMVKICDEFEPYFEKENFLENAPFDVISLIIRYGKITNHVPEIEKINRYSELEVAIELAMDSVRKADYSKLEMMIRKATLHSIIQVGKKYKLPTETFGKMLKNLV